MSSFQGVRLSVLANRATAFTISVAMARTVLIVDDHPSFRASARMLLESEGFDVVGEAQDGRSALTAIRDLLPAGRAARRAAPRHQRLRRGHAAPRNGSMPMVVFTSSRDVDDLGPLADVPCVRGFIPKSELSGAALEALL